MLGSAFKKKAGSGSAIKVMRIRNKACDPNWLADDKTRVADPDSIYYNYWIWIFLHGTATLNKRTRYANCYLCEYLTSVADPDPSDPELFDQIVSVAD